MAAVVDARVLERFVHRQVRVVELHVLADEADLDGPLALADPVGQLGPLAELSAPRGSPSFWQTRSSIPCSCSAAGTR